MKLGVMDPVLGGYGTEQMLEYLQSLHVQAVELGSGGFPGERHMNPQKLAQDPLEAKAFLKLFEQYDIEIAALACHGNPLHPHRDTAARYDEKLHNAILAAENLGVETVITFSGCPGDCENSRYPNWVTCPWPDDFGKILEWQWNEKLIPYWRETAQFAKQHGVKRIALEMHPGFCVYNPETLLRLREQTDEIITANVDPSHLFWQGIDPVAAIKALKGAIGHFHAKDTCIDERTTAVNGVLDTKSYADIANRSWLFRTVGYGHGKETWNAIISALKTVGYDGVISIEHEDSLMSPEEGLEKAVRFLQEVLIFRKEGEAWWI